MISTKNLSINEIRTSLSDSISEPLKITIEQVSNNVMKNAYVNLLFCLQVFQSKEHVFIEALAALGVVSSSLRRVRRK